MIWINMSYHFIMNKQLHGGIPCKTITMHVLVCNSHWYRRFVVFKIYLSLINFNFSLFVYMYYNMIDFKLYIVHVYCFLLDRKLCLVFFSINWRVSKHFKIYLHCAYLQIIIFPDRGNNLVVIRCISALYLRSEVYNREETLHWPCLSIRA